MNIICRLCLGENVQLLHVSESKGLPGWTATTAINELLQMEISEDDMYPKFICTECMGKLVDFKLFKHQCEINKDSLDLVIRRNGEFRDNEEVVGMVFCSSDKNCELHSEDEDVEVPIEKDPLELSEEEVSIKAEIEESLNEYNEVSSDEVIGSADQISHRIKSVNVDQVSFVNTNDINIPQNISTDAMQFKEEYPDSEPELTLQVSFNTGFSKDKTGCSYVSHNTSDAHSSLPQNDTRGPIHVSNLSSMEDISGNEENATESNPISSHTSVKPISRKVSVEECFNLEGKQMHKRVPLRYSHIPKDIFIDSNLEKGNADDKCMNFFMQFKTEDCLQKHMSAECGMAPTRKRDLKMDMTYHSDDSGFTCNECNKSYSNKVKLSRHIRNHSAEKRFKCHECSKCFPHNSHLKIHMRVHSGERPYKCNQCSMSFSRTSSLTLHTRIHSGEKPFNCHVCNKSFSIKNTLKNHMRIHSGEKPFNCHVCNKSFSIKSTLKNHMRIHSGEKPYKCNRCSKSFSRQSYVTTHMRVHSGDKPFKCNLCSKSFSQLTSLNNHTRVHSGEKPFKCFQCSSSFSQKSTLITHMRIHSGEKPYKCNLCSKSFTQKSTLTLHMRVHSREKPFMCNQCSKSFSQKSTLILHMRLHSVEKPFR